MKPSKGLEYKYYPELAGYFVCGIGTCADTHVIIPDLYRKKPVIGICNSAFGGCQNLISIVLPRSIKYIHSFAFTQCDNLTNITIPGSVKTIDGYAFDSCCHLAKVIIEDGVENIAAGAFSTCSELTEISIPSSVKSIDYDAFIDCVSLNKRGAWKATHADFTCGRRSFTLGAWYEESDAKLCEVGFHFCENVFDIFEYYFGKLGEDLRIFKVEVADVSPEHSCNSKRVCKKVKFVHEITSYADLSTYNNDSPEDLK